MFDSRNIRMFDYFTVLAQPFRESICAQAERVEAKIPQGGPYPGDRRQAWQPSGISSRLFGHGALFVVPAVARQEDRHDAPAARHESEKGKPGPAPHGQGW